MIALILPYILIAVCLGLPCLILGWFAWDCWRIGRELDEQDKL